jgi:hypothetical protein
MNNIMNNPMGYRQTICVIPRIPSCMSPNRIGERERIKKILHNRLRHEVDAIKILFNKNMHGRALENKKIGIGRHFLFKH